MTITQQLNPNKEKKALTTISELWANYRYRKSHLTPDQCVLATRFSSILLTHAGIEHEVIPVAVVVFNQKGWEFVKAKKSFTKDGDEWSVRLSVKNPVPPLKPTHICGHVAVVTNNYYFDPTSEQLSRPQRQMELPNSLLVKSEKHTKLSDDYKSVYMLLQSKLTVRHVPILSSHYCWTYEPENTNYLDGECYRQTPEEVIERLDFNPQKTIEKIRNIK